MVTKEDAYYFLSMRSYTGGRKSYYALLKNKNSDEYIRFITVYMENKHLLSDREQLVLESNYGINGPSMKYKEIGAIINVTLERVRQIINTSERKIAQNLRRKFNIKDK